jgi:hypothetical protein
MYKYLILFVLLTTYFSCKEGTVKKAGSGSIMSKYAPLSSEIISEYNKNVSSVDLISLKKEVNVSMNFDNAQAVQYVISFIGNEVGIVDNLCKPDGHIVLFNNGELINEADIYFSSNCNAMVWMTNQQPTNCNILTPEGVDFYKNFLKPRNNSDLDSLKAANK